VAEPARKLPPVWLMGLANLPWGVNGALALITVPQLLAARHVPEPQIASVTAFAMIPTFCGFLLSPMLDVRFSRRSYAFAFALTTALFDFAALASIGDLRLLAILLFLGMTAGVLFTGAVGGWLASLVPGESDKKLGAWFSLANIGGFGVTAIVAITLLRGLPYIAGAAVLVLILIAPTLMFVRFPAPGPDRKLASESFGQMGRDIFELVRQRVVLRSLLLFVLPAASFALTNMLGGLGNIYSTSERMVGLIAGLGVTLAGVVGSLAVPRLGRNRRATFLYVAIGAVGALFTLSLVALPRTPAVYALAMIGENVFQAAAFAAQYAIVFDTIGKNNPLAATQFAFLTAAPSLPITYMQAVDGHFYGIGGLNGAYLADGGAALVACAFLFVMFARWGWMRKGRRAGFGLEAPAR
jgi:MFS transporter, PAT family, beta-lactamase induction signal transducer AmpG